MWVSWKDGAARHARLRKEGDVILRFGGVFKNLGVEGMVVLHWETGKVSTGGDMVETNSGRACRIKDMGTTRAFVMHRVVP